jgi:ATP-dependent helicase HrpA
MQLHYPDILPITNHRREIVEAIRDNLVTIVVGETGSGKSTQIPKMILEALAEIEKIDPTDNELKVVCTQPRRIAATSIASRIAEESEVKLGQQVGYKIRFDDDTTRGTMITICTDGILLQEMKGDRLLSMYDAVLVDEAHERNLNIDFLLGLLKSVQRSRKEQGLKLLKIIVTSATVDASKFARFFTDVQKLSSSTSIPVINVSGRTYPVDIKYAPLERGTMLFLQVADLVQHAALQSKNGDMLIFMPGEQEIFETIRAIELLKLPRVRCLPLFSRLTMEEQQRIFEPHEGTRNIVVATNIAETSLTVPGIKYVIDPGLARMTDFDFRTGIGSLEIRKISQASAIQRAGRAGRIEPGICYRLYDEEDFKAREKYTKPEIQRSDLASVLLHMILIGIKDVYNFEFIDPPDANAFKNAYKTLHELGALDSHNQLTDLGLKMAHLPLEPRIACMLLAAERYECVREVAIIASSLSVKDPFLRPNGEEEEADQAKKYFQRVVMQANRKSRYVKVRKGRKFVMKKVWDYGESRNSFGGSTKRLASDLLTLLVVYKKVQGITDLEARESYCKENYLNHKTLQEIELINEQLLDTLRQFGGEEFAKYLDDSKPQVDFSQTNFIEFSPELVEGILKSIASGLIQNVCEKSAGFTYRSKSADNIFIHPSSALFLLKPQWLVAAEIIETTKLYARNNTEIDPMWFEEIAPHLCTYKYGKMYFSSKTGQVMREENIFFKGHRIVDARASEVVAKEKHAAFEFFVREGLVKRTLANKFRFLHENEKIREKLQGYAAKSVNPTYVLEDWKLFDWYTEKCSKLKIQPSSSKELAKILQEKGQDILQIKVEDFVSEAEQARLNHLYPDYGYLDGEKMPIRYFYGHYKYPDGPVISLSVLNLRTLTAEKIKKMVPDNFAFKPFILICSDESFTSPIVSGYDPAKVKKSYDEHHLKKAWKFARRKVEVGNIRGVEEAKTYLKYVLEKVEIGESLFFGEGEEAKVSGYIGLQFESKKFELLLFDEWAKAFKATLGAVRKIFEISARKELEFAEEDIVRLEQKYEKYFFGIDLQTRLEEILEKKLAFESSFKDFEKLKDVKYVAKVLYQKKADLPEIKKKIISRFEEILDQVDALQAKNSKRSGKVDPHELAAFKAMLEQGEGF